ncbi:MAG: SDR family oxidoreductase [Schlesneria sp.]
MFTRISERYRNCTAVVIGAGGIGGAIVRMLAGNVSNLVIADQNQTLLDALPETSGSTTLWKRKLDVRDKSAVCELFTEIETTVGVLDYLFYAAGILNIEPLAETTPDLWNRAMDINLNGAFYCVQAATVQMQSQQRGSIVVLGSIAGTKARSGSRVNPVYNTTKAGLAAFVNAAAMQLRSHHVRINCISPGPTETVMMDLQPPQVHAAVNEIALDGRMNDPVEVAELALFIAAHGRFTGEDICMGGGAGLGG